MRWYNDEHRHSGISYVTPAQRHAGADRHVLQARHALYQQARENNPRRWSRHARNWDGIEVVALNRAGTGLAGRAHAGQRYTASGRMNQARTTLTRADSPAKAAPASTRSTPSCGVMRERQIVSVLRHVVGSR